MTTPSTIRSHLAIVSSDGTRILLALSSAGWLLPSRTIARGDRAAELLCWLGAQFGPSVAVLDVLAAEYESTEAEVLVLLVAFDDNLIAPGAFVWHPIASEFPGRPIVSFQSCVRDALVGGRFSDASRERVKELRGVFGWVSKVLTSTGRAALCGVWQRQASRSRAIFECSLEDKSTVFCLTGTSVAGETEVTEFLAKRLPGHFVKTIACSDQAWLTESVPGRCLHNNLTLPNCLRAVECLAQVQMSIAQETVFPSAVTLLGPQQCYNELAWLTDQFRARIAVSPVDVNKIRSLLCRTLDAWANIHIPITVTHGDFAPANVYMSPEEITFIDLETAVWTLPLASLWEMIARVETTLQDRSWRPALVESYMSSWNALVPREELQSALRIAPILRVLSRLIVFLRTPGLREPARCWYPQWYDDTARQYMGWLHRKALESASSRSPVGRVHNLE